MPAGYRLISAIFAVALLAAPAAAQGKEGTSTDTWGGFGTAKAIQIGKDRILVATEEHNFCVSNDPMFGHLTSHCFGVADFTKGVGQNQGRCVETDPAGDQIVLSYDTGNFTLGKTFKGSLTLIGGTGKFAGITGGGTYVYDGFTFKTTEEGTYTPHFTLELSYKLP